jgi:hypothetical protein
MPLGLQAADVNVLLPWILKLAKLKMAIALLPPLANVL